MPITDDAPSPQPVTIAVNGGSSSIKCAAFVPGDPPRRVLSVTIERVGSREARLMTSDEHGRRSETPEAVGSSNADATAALIAALRRHLGDDRVAAIGHRIVQGGLALLAHRLIDDGLLSELRAVRSLDLTHLPSELALIEAFQAAYAGVPQVACFDSAFHRDLPQVAQTLPIPRRYLDRGYRRLGFHGLSYAYLMQELQRRGQAGGRIVLAHLGSGASLAAVKDGAVIDTTMGFTPTSGLVMGSRPGDLDPGLIAHLIRRDGLSAGQLDELISHQCGLLGISGTTSDMRELGAKSAADPHAALAIAVFCYQARKAIGALAAALGGLDLLVFSGGIGEHAAAVRSAICDGLSFIGIELDPAANMADDSTISTPRARTQVLVLRTDEESMIATITTRLTQPTRLAN